MKRWPLYRRWQCCRESQAGIFPSADRISVNESRLRRAANWQGRRSLPLRRWQAMETRRSFVNPPLEFNSDDHRRELRAAFRVLAFPFAVTMEARRAMAKPAPNGSSFTIFGNAFAAARNFGHASGCGADVSAA